jgi:hypothetical protein
MRAEAVARGRLRTGCSCAGRAAACALAGGRPQDLALHGKVPTSSRKLAQLIGKVRPCGCGRNCCRRGERGGARPRHAPARASADLRCCRTGLQPEERAQGCVAWGARRRVAHKDERRGTSAANVWTCSPLSLSLSPCQVFLQSSTVNLLSTICDTPEFFWSAPDQLRALYDRSCEYMELEARAQVLNARFEAREPFIWRGWQAHGAANGASQLSSPWCVRPSGVAAGLAGDARDPPRSQGGQRGVSCSAVVLAGDTRRLSA